LLRLTIQKLTDTILGKDKTESLNTTNIELLVKKGLQSDIQKALDVVRVIGNSAVHPEQIDLRDNTEIAVTFFKLVNGIVQGTITEPREIDSIYNDLP